MTFATPDKVLSRFPRLPHSRAALGLAHAVSDSQTRNLFGSGNLLATLDSEPDYFKTLLDDSTRKIWDKYTDTTKADEFPQKLAKGTASLNGFRRYWIQDCVYLEEYVKVRLEAIINSGDTVSSDELRDFTKTATIGLDYAAQFQDDCVQKLGVPLDAVKKGWSDRSTQLKNSIDFYTKVASGVVDPDHDLPGTARPWVDIHFTLLPCIKGYYEIATKLLKDPTIVKNTPFYTMWISGNSDSSFVKEYDDFLTKATAAAKPEDWERWRKIFAKACGLEQDFLTLATQGYGPYDILPKDNTTYTISPYGDQTKYLDVTGNEVTLTTTSAKWTFKNVNDGYTIQHATTNQYLTFSAPATVQAPPYYEIKIDATSKEWPINPISVYDTDGKVITAYQLFVLENLAFVLDHNKDNSKVFGANDYQGVSQGWILTPAY